MSFDIDYTRTAAKHVRGYRKYEQQIILDAADEQLGIVKIKAVGHKVHNKLYIAGKEFEL